MGNLKLDGRTIAIIAVLVIAAVVFLPQILGGNNSGAVNNPPAQDQGNPRDTTINTEDGIEFGRVVTTTNVDRNGCPTDVTSSFPAGTDLVYVVAQNAEVTSGTEVYVRWYLDGQVYEDAEPITADQDYQDTCINFLLEPDDANTLRSGDYEAEFIINGNPADTVNFQIG